MTIEICVLAKSNLMYQIKIVESNKSAVLAKKIGLIMKKLHGITDLQIYKLL